MKNKFMKGMLVTIGVIFLLSSLVLAIAKPAATVATVKGKAEVSFSTNVWKPLKAGDQLYENDVVRTGKNGTVGIKFDPKTISNISENSEVKISEFKSELFGKKKNKIAKKINLKVLKGGVFSKLKKLNSKSTFKVSTPSAVCGVRGTSFDVEGNGKISCLEGELAVFNPEFPDQVIKVSKGMKTVVKKGKKPKKPRKMSKKELKKLVKKEKQAKKIEKKKMKLRPTMIDQSYQVVGSTDAGKEVEYTVKFKNLDAAKYKAVLMISNDKGAVIAKVPMKLESGGKNIASIKTFKVKHTIKVKGKITHRFSLMKK